MNFKMIVTDLDDTLLNKEGQISKRNKEALYRAQEKGIVVVPVSGRSHYGMRQVADVLRLKEHNGYLISFNGARIFDYAKEEELFSSNVSSADGELLYRLAMEHGAKLQTYRGNQIIVTGANKYTEYEAGLTGMEVVCTEDFCTEIQTFPTVKYVMTEEPERLREIAEKILPEIPKRLNVSFTKPFFLEFFDSETDKGTSVRKLAGYLGIQREEILAFGDSYNDISMIEKAGFGVAMANAVEDAKRAADYVAGTNEEDGLAAVVEEYCLNKT